MSIIEGVVVGAETGGFYTTEIEQSLRFNDDDSAYLSWTPASVGNRKTWTFSTWVKRGNTGLERGIFSVGASGATFALFFHSSDQLRVWTNGGNAAMYTNAVYRDSSAWYHIVLQSSSTSPYLKLYVNGEEITSFSYDNRTTYPSTNDTEVNSVDTHRLGGWYNGGIQTMDGYLAETHFIDGTAYDATAFGEFKNGVWIPKTPSVTYGTNGFYLPYRNDYTVEGFSAVTWNGSDDKQYIGGVGFSPDLVWIKCRDTAYSNYIQDTIRGTDYTLYSDLTAADTLAYNRITSFDTDGFTLGQNAGVNTGGSNYVAWCWDAGTGSPVSNTDGSITSTVKANPSRGFSVVSYTGTGSNATVGHGLSSAPDMVIVKDRSGTEPWRVWSVGFSSIGFATLNDTTAFVSNSTVYSSAPTSSVVNIGTSVSSNGSGKNYIAYCFHSVAGYSKMGSYTGTGASGNKITTGFKPAFVLTKMTSSAGEWRIHDSTRSATDPRNDILYANQSAAELVDNPIDFDNDGFTLQHGLAQENGSGSTYIYMAFADTREAAFWLDDSGNNNDWENNGLTESDISLDSPTNNFATLNATSKSSDTTLSEGNLKASYGSSYGGVAATIAMTSGKWYWESVITAISATGSHIGVLADNYADNSNTALSLLPGYATTSYGYRNDGLKLNSDAGSAYGASYTTGDIVGVAIDVDSGTLTFYKNGVSQGTAFTGLTGGFIPAFGDGATTATHTLVANFGQDSSFAGNKTPQGYTDANGIGDFYYAPPAGYLALCTANLPEPAIGPNSATTADENFNTVLYTGDGSASRTISASLSPDLTWIKVRNTTYDHMLIDRVRGTGKYIASSSTNAENWAGNIFPNSTPTTDGFIVDGHLNNSINGSGSSYVAWNWKADNTSGSTNTDGTITSTVAANVDAGFSIVSYTGTGAASATLGHGLNTAPEVVIIKNRSVSDNWIIYHKHANSVPESGFMLFTTSSFYADARAWGGPIGVGSGSQPSATVVTVGANDSGIGYTNGNTNNYIAYCFHSVEGYSKFGSYTGNGSTDGPFVYTGFRPAFVVAKGSSIDSPWVITDSSRDDYNPEDSYLLADGSDAESVSTRHDFLSNGFKMRTTGHNASGQTYIYMAFAENPFKYSNAR